MPRLSIDEKITKERRKVEQAKARLVSLEARERVQRKKDETRTKILLGAYLLQSWEQYSSAQIEGQLKAIDTFLTRDKDKQLVPRVLKAMLAKPTKTTQGKSSS